MISNILSRIIYGGGVLFDLAKWLILALIAFMILNTFFYSIFIVDGASMDPNFKDGEWILWNKNVYDKTNPKRGDIVVVNYPGDPNHKKYVKRVVGLPGDEIEIKEGLVYLDGDRLKEDYLRFDVDSSPDGNWKMGNGEYFVMGDNRPNSNDSRYFGAVKKRFIQGKSISIIFPRFRLTKDI